MASPKKRDQKFVQLFSDGGARGNPGPAAAGFVVKDTSGKILYQEKKYLGETTNNVAEYQGVLLCLTWLLKSDLDFDFALYHLDSELIVRQLTGVYKIKSEKLKPLVLKVKDLERQIGRPIKYQHVPRSKNQLADRLVNQALDQNRSGT